jgi:pimeloyl-ACP methyl ester carboxylesterase
MPKGNDWQTLFPFESHYLSVGRHRYHYVDEGSGPVLLMVHGNPTWSFYWRDLIRAWRDKYRVVAVDHIGCGLSDKPHERSYSYTLQQRIDDLGVLIEKLDLQDITLLAHDWGGAIGMGAAVDAPQRFGRFVLFNTGAFTGERCPWRIRICRIPWLGRLAVQGLNLFARSAIRMAVERHERITGPVKAGLLAPYDNWQNRTGVYRFVMDIPLGERHPSYRTLQKIESGLPHFRGHPVCLIWGMRDWCFTPRFLDRFLEYFPQAEAHRLGDAGHYVVEDAHERIIPLVEAFLQESRGE